MSGIGQRYGLREMSSGTAAAVARGARGRGGGGRRGRGLRGRAALADRRGCGASSARREHATAPVVDAAAASSAGRADGGDGRRGVTAGGRRRHEAAAPRRVRRGRSRRCEVQPHRHRRDGASADSASPRGTHASSAPPAASVQRHDRQSGACRSRASHGWEHRREVTLDTLETPAAGARRRRQRDGHADAADAPDGRQPVAPRPLGERRRLPCPRRA